MVYTDPEMQKIAEQMVAIRNREMKTGMGMHELFEQSFLLPAQLGDTQRKNRGKETMLVNAYRDAWRDPGVAALYGEGKNGDVSNKGKHRKDTSDEMAEIDRDPALRALLNPDKDSDDEYVTPARELLSTHFDAKAIDVRLLRSLIKSIDHGGEAQWAIRSRDFDSAEIPSGIRAMLTLDMLANEARMLLRSWLKDNQKLDPTSVPDYMSSQQAKDAHIKKLQSVIKPKGFSVAYLKGIEERLTDMVEERARFLYKDNAEEMMNLWRSVNYLISSKFSQGDVSEFRRSVYEALNEEDKKVGIAKARALIRPRILRNPEAFTPAAKNTFSVTDEELKATRLERGTTHKMTKEGKAEYAARKKQQKDQETLQPIVPYIGKTLYDKANDRLIYCIGTGKISRARKSYDKKTHRNIETTSDIPAMEVTYFPRPKSGSSSQARKEPGFIGPGEFLTRIQKGEYQILETASLDQNTTEIDVKIFPRKE